MHEAKYYELKQLYHNLLQTSNSNERWENIKNRDNI